MSADLHYDVVVLGCGVAGLTAATRLAEGGARVCVLAKGVGSTHLAPGTVDVLGHDSSGLVESPSSALPGFIAAFPDHPYALAGADALEPALEWLGALVERGPHPGYRYVGSLERNHLLPTAIGAIRPSALVPETMAEGDTVASQDPVCVAGIQALRDFHPSLCAGNLRRAGIKARAVVLDLDVGRVEINALGLARKLDDQRFRAAFAAELTMLLRPGERVALPAALGLLDPHTVWTDLRRRLGRPVFEIPTLPPSAPGMRLYNALVAGLRAARGRFILGAEVIGAERDGDRVTALRAHTSGRDTTFGARWVVLATGGFASGAIELGSDWEAREHALGLALRGMPEPGQPRFSADYFGDHPMSRVGIAVDQTLRAVDVENVFVAGAALPGAVPWHEGSGEGIALATGSFVARSVLEREGATATA
jgi:glycerol-3-phosphate dehydrogenase subunit B